MAIKQKQQESEPTDPAYVMNARRPLLVTLWSPWLTLLLLKVLKSTKHNCKASPTLSKQDGVEDNNDETVSSELWVRSSRQPTGSKSSGSVVMV